jgi:ribosomal protein S27E
MLIVFPLYTIESQCRKTSLRLVQPHVASFTSQTLPGVVAMVSLATNPKPIYRPRRPRQSPLFKTIERYLPEFERTYERSYAKQYGPWRRIIGDVTRRFLRCGDLHYGFARVRCPDCHHEMFVAFSCQQRCLCPSCHQKRTLLTAETIASSRKRRASFSWCSIPNSFRASLLPRLFSHRDFPVQLAVRAAGPLQGGESSSVSDFRTVYALLGPKIVKLASDRPDHVG